MKTIIGLSVFAALALTCSSAAVAADACDTLTFTGHPQYPVIAFKEGDKIVGAAADLVEAIGGELKVPVQSKFTGTWADAQAAAREGKVDMIVGIYYNDERGTYLDYVQPAFNFDQVAVFVAKGKGFPYTGQEDLIGKKGVTNQGESYGTDFDAFIDKSLTVARTDGIDAAFADLMAGKADYVIAGYYPGIAEADKMGIEDKVEALSPTLITAEMFVAFSKKSPCRTLAPEFGQAVAAMTTDGRFHKMLTGAMEAWNNANPPKE